MSMPISALTNVLAILHHYQRAKTYQPPQQRSDLLKWQDQQVQAFVDRIRAKSPFYQEHWEGIPSESWATFPCIDKAVWMTNFDRMNTVGLCKKEALEFATTAETHRQFQATLKGITVGLSSGTSGQRGLFLASPTERQRWAGEILAHVLPKGLLHPERIAFFLRADSTLYEQLALGWIRFQFFDLLAPLTQHVVELDRLKPTLLVGPPALLRLLAMAQRKGDLHIKPRRIFSVADVLDANEVTLLEATFQCPVGQVYQATEGFLGISCSQGHIHLNEHLVAIQQDVLDANTGHFTPILTDFTRESQPLVRYRLTDVLLPLKMPCPCGSSHLALERIEGRCDELLWLPNIKDATLQPVFPDFIVRWVLQACPNVETFCVQQTQTLEWQVGLPQEAFSLENEATVATALEQDLVTLCQQLGVQRPQWRLESYFPPPLEKKRRRVRCLCPPEQEGF
jgi:putative adenylate-forming enzyme